MQESQISAVDGFVLAMLGMMVLSGGVVATMIFCGLRNSARRDQQVDDLIDEVSRKPEPEKEPPAPSKAETPKPEPEPWEREDQWWRK